MSTNGNSKNGAGVPGTGTRPVGRPTDYNQDIAHKLCEAISTENLSIRQIDAREDLPAKATIFRWLSKHPEFRDQYAQARTIQAEYKAHEIEQLVDDCSEDRDAVQLCRLRVDTKKWLMSKLNGKYGDSTRTQLEVSGQVNHAHKHTLHCNIPTRLSVAEWLEHKKQEQQLLDVTPQADAMPDKVSYQSSKESASNTPQSPALIAPRRTEEQEDG